MNRPRSNFPESRVAFPRGVRASSDLGGGGGGGGMTFLPKKICAMPKRVGVEILKLGYKRRRLPFSHLMKLLSLEK